MAILTIYEATAAYGNNPPSDVKMKLIISALSDGLSKVCNRAFASRASSVIVSGSSVTLTVPGHRLRVGDQVRISTESDVVDGLFTVTAVVTGDSFTVTIDAITQGELDNREITVRRVREVTFATDGTPSVFLDPRPIAEVLEVSRNDGNGGWLVVDPSEYQLAEDYDGISYIGELIALNRNWPGTPRGIGQVRAGVKVRFIAGESMVPPEAIYVMTRVMEQYRLNTKFAGLQSESNDGYSFSRMSGSEIQKIFGEIGPTINQLKLPVL